MWPGLTDFWTALMATTPDDKLLSSSDLHDALERVGMCGSQVTEVFDVLIGPDYAGGGSNVSLGMLRAALENLPDDAIGNEGEDPIGLTYASFLDGACVVESLSLRACSLDWPEMAPIAGALARCPWQLRCLNFWDNRICDRGAAALGDALEQYRGLEYLGLGRNRITDIGLAALCKPFHAAHISEAEKKGAQDRIKDQTAQVEAKSKAAAKAKAAPKATDRVMREPSPFVDELEERPAVVEGGEASFVLRRPAELKTLVLSENPIKNMRTIEMLQPQGPKGVELLLRQTPAGTALAAKRPELSTKDRKPFCPGNEGWVVRVS